MSLSKQQLRAHYRALQDQAEFSPAGHLSACHRILQWLAGQERISKVFGYVGVRNELRVQELGNLLSSRYKFCLPLITGPGDMEFCLYDGGSLIKNRFGIPEPEPFDCQIVRPDNESLILLPALSVDLHGYRLGYGGGYYDRYLQRYSSKGALMAVIWQQSMSCDPLPRDPWDVAVQWIATEQTGVFRARPPRALSSPDGG